MWSNASAWTDYDSGDDRVFPTSGIVCVESPRAFGEAYAASAVMRQVFDLLECLSATHEAILLEGESGVGKEVLARSIHQRSPRAKGPFTGVRCSAIPAESEVFGNVGGASSEGEGLFARAHGGTIFLDEIGDLPLELQPRLLRVLDHAALAPRGPDRGSGDGGPCSHPPPLGVRVIAATTRRLGAMVSRDEFRPDLFYRLAVARLTIPPLRARRDDVLPLARKFLRERTGDVRADIPTDVAELFWRYDWPGNVRELGSVVDRFVLLGAREPRALFDRTGPDVDGLAELPYHEARAAVLAPFERAYAERVLARAGGVVVRAAELAEMGRASFYRLLDRVRIEGPRTVAEERRREGRAEAARFISSVKSRLGCWKVALGVCEHRQRRHVIGWPYGRRSKGARSPPRRLAYAPCPGAVLPHDTAGVWLAVVWTSRCVVGT
jgi:transcriptional regulator with PAS, ATPase and Fis domain